MTIRIHYRVTVSTNDMVVIVTDLCFIKRWLTFWLNFTNNSALNQRIQIVVNRLF